MSKLGAPNHRRRRLLQQLIAFGGASLLPTGSLRAARTIRFADDVSGLMQSALFDPQTAGGLLVSLPAAKAAEFLARVPGSATIGSVDAKGSYLIEVT